MNFGRLGRTLGKLGAQVKPAASGGGATSNILLEDGTSKVLQEDGASKVIKES